MANFTTEDAVRLRFQLNDTAVAPTTLLSARIDDAHAEVLRLLNPDYDVVPAAAGLVLGETLLAGACVLRSLAAGEALGQKHIMVGGQRIEAGERFASLMAMASLAEDQAWHALEPYLEARRRRAPMAASDSVPVLGEEEA